MNTLAVEIRMSEALNVLLTDDTLSVDLSDGRSISVPIAWFPRLLHSTEQERNNWRLIGRGQGIHWEDLDEDISIESLLALRSGNLFKWSEQIKEIFHSIKMINLPN
jgi:hypothetical protein